MASELDIALNDVMDRLTAAGAPLETIPFERFKHLDSRNRTAHSAKSRN